MVEKQKIKIICTVLFVCAVLCMLAYWTPKPYSDYALGGLVIIIGVCSMMSKTH